MPAPGLEIMPRPDLPAIVARWQREISAPELQAGYFAILAAADELGCWRWLLDLRRREELVSPELTAWMNNDFFPQLHQRYGKPVRIAYLISPLRATREQPVSFVAASSTSSPAAAAHVMALFIDEAAAYQWLAE